MSQNEVLLTKPEAAAVLRVSIKTLERWAAAGMVTPIRFGRTVRFRAADIRRLADDGCTPDPDLWPSTIDAPGVTR